MFHLMGGLFCSLGCAGYGMALILAKRRENRICEQLYMIFLRMKSVLIVEKELIENACMRMSDSVTTETQEEKTFFAEVGELTKSQRKREFSDIWREEVEIKWKGKIRQKEMYALLYSFPEYVENCDAETLISCYERFLHGWESMLQSNKREQREKEKLVFTVSLFCGLLISILLI